MSYSILDKLKVKPVPAKKETVQIAIPVPAKQETVEIKTTIVDKRGEMEIDRDAIMEKIKASKFYKGVVSKEIEQPKRIQREPSAIISPIREETELLSQTTPKKSIKLKKFKLTEEPIEQIAEQVEAEEVVAPVEQTGITDKQLAQSIRRIVDISDLDTITIKIVKQKLEEEYATDLSSRMNFIRTEIRDALLDKVRKESASKVQAQVAPEVIPEVQPEIVVEPPAPAVLAKKRKPKFTIVEEEKKEEAPAEVIEEDKGEIMILKKPKKIRVKTIIQEQPFSMLKIGKYTVGERLAQPKPKVKILASNYYMNNRQVFVNFITSLFGPYRKDFLKDKKTFSCDDAGDFSSLLTHQNIVRDYMNLYTPYRGLLLYHGLGSGKTCSSIAIAEGMKSDKLIYVMTPASLRMNYVEELKKCGDSIYKKRQYWEFISTKQYPELIEPLSSLLSLPVETIRSQGGAWFVNVKKPSNFETLASQDKESLDKQLNEMIRTKYRFINYNGLRNALLNTLSANDTINPFDNSVVIVDEAHNFISRIVNKLKKPGSLSMKLYDYLMNADNCKIILLTGTPMINYPNEIAVLFNILRGKIKTWTFKLNVSGSKKVSQETIKSLFESKLHTRRLLDFVEYKPTSTTLTITRNPFGFISNYKSVGGEYEGVTVDERGNVSDADFIKLIASILKKEGIEIVQGSTTVESFKALPDSLDDFNTFFIDSKTNTMKNVELFKKRILGLTSYFRDIEELMPRFDKGRDMHIVKIPMSDFQFTVYEEARVAERKLEAKNAMKKKAAKGKNDLYNETVSTYRIFSRAFCNFVFPRPDIIRPMPKEGENFDEALEEGDNEDILDAASVEEQLENVDGLYEADDEERLIAEREKNIDGSYESRVQAALAKLWRKRDTYLTPDGLEIYSPKFLRILENIQDPEMRGLHLMYSQFRTIEGIGVFKLILLANGFAEFKIKKNDAGQWIIDIPERDLGKPTFALYTGTESREEREIIRNIFNSTWAYVPSTIVSQMETISSNNMYGEIIKLLMITASGAEGISLRNVRYVHLTESYWHPVRLEQVIGRARRICSHVNLPESLQNVQVFLYLMTFTREQLAGDDAIELKLKDKSKIDGLTPVTSDESLWEISNLKLNITNQILKAVKEAAIDCAIPPAKDNKEALQCFSFGAPTPDRYSYLPSIGKEEQDIEARVNKRTITWVPEEIEISGIKYIFRRTTGEIFDYDSFGRGNPIKVGELEFYTDKRSGEKMFRFKPI